MKEMRLLDDVAIREPTYDELENELYRRAEYKFVISMDGSYTILRKGPFNIFAIFERGCTVQYVKGTEKSDGVVHSPTEEFWVNLLSIEHTTAELSEHRRHVSPRIADSLPDPEHYKHPEFRNVPQYEKEILFELSAALFKQRLDTLFVHREFPNLRYLLRQAFVSLDEPVPSYLEEDELLSDESESLSDGDDDAQ